MVPIRDVVVFPYTMVAFVIGRPASVRALEAALRGDKTIFLATQHDATIDEPTVEQVYTTGTIARITHNLRLPDGNIKVMVEGIERARSVRVEDNGDYWLATLRKAALQVEPRSRLNALIGRVGSLVDQYVRQSTELTNPETLTAALRNDDPARLCDTIASNLKISVEDKQGLLEIFSLQDRLARLIEVLEVELEKIQVDRAIHGRVKTADGARAKRVLPQREDQGDTQRARPQGREGRTRRAEAEDRGRGHVEGRLRKGYDRASPPRTDAADVGRIYRVAQLPGLAPGRSVEGEDRRGARHKSGARGLGPGPLRA